MYLSYVYIDLQNHMIRKEVIHEQKGYSKNYIGQLVSHQDFRPPLHTFSIQNDVIKWKPLPRNWPFVRGIHRWPVNSPHKGQWRRALTFSLIWINCWVNNREAGDLRRHRVHYDISVMWTSTDNLQVHQFRELLRMRYECLPTIRVFETHMRFVATLVHTSKEWSYQIEKKYKKHHCRYCFDMKPFTFLLASNRIIFKSRQQKWNDRTLAAELCCFEYTE